LFHNRFFQREEGGTNVRQVWLEVQVQHALSLAQHRECPDAIKIVDHLGEPVPNLAFTHDGLEPFLRSARFSYLLGNVYKSCNVSDKAQDHFKQAAAKSNFGDAIWAWKAAQQLPGNDPNAGKEKLQKTLEQAKNSGENSAAGWWLYNAGTLDSALGNTQLAESEFRRALLSPDSLMTYHLTRLALSGGL